MKIEFIAGKRFLRWEYLGWQQNDDIDGIEIPVGITINLSALYAEYGGYEVALISEIMHVIEHETLHYCIHTSAYFRDGTDQEEVTNMLQVLPRNKFRFPPVSLIEEDDDWLVGYI